jgi:UDP-N-acetyl-D-mannosaminuronic acid transferase (WecB/TagA/CpsF family)
MATYNYIGDGNPDGSIFGATSTEKISFYGATPVVRRTKATSVTTTGASSTTNAYGYTTAAQADAIVTAINAIIVNLTDLGLTN